MTELHRTLLSYLFGGLLVAMLVGGAVALGVR